MKTACMKIPLTRNFEALIDKQDFEIVRQYKWHTHESHKGYFYAVTNIRLSCGKRAILKMHRLLLGLHDRNVKVDHKDGNGLNNKRSNIRICTQGQNVLNTSVQKNNTTGLKGVSFSKKRNVYVARLMFNGEYKLCKQFKTAEEAYKAYCEAARKFHGEFAKY